MEGPERHPAILKRCQVDKPNFINRLTGCRKRQFAESGQVRRAGQPQRWADTITVAYSQAGLLSHIPKMWRKGGPQGLGRGWSASLYLQNLTIWGGKISAPPVGQVTSETRRSLW